MPASPEITEGTILVAAPHSDDEVLGCGGLIALAAGRGSKILVVLVTDSARMPGFIDPPSPDDARMLAEERAGESIAALKLLGVPESGVRFLDMPCGSLSATQSRLEEMLSEIIRSFAPDRILTPFRMDFHPDHRALGQACLALRRKGTAPDDILEYFVYYRRRMLRKGDIRRYIRDDYLVSLDIGSVSQLKRKALECFITQTTTRHSFQVKPVLSQAILEESSAGPEIYLHCPAGIAAGGILKSDAAWIRFADFAEPRLKRIKDSISMRSRRT